jgi:pimeloyl-ACP methyl ester carboxylesterase
VEAGGPDRLINRVQTGGWLLLHGTPLTPQVWDGVAALLGDARVLRPVVEASPGEAHPQTAIAGRLAERLAESAPLHIVGHSFGGQIALELALAAPGLVHRLTIICSRDTPYPAFAAAADAVRRGDPFDVDGALSRWFRPSELADDGPMVQYARRCLRTADPTRWAAALDAIAEYDRSGRTPEIEVPVILLTAEFDQVSTPAAMSDMAHRLPNAQLRLLDGAAHMSPFLDPSRLVRLIT